MMHSHRNRWLLLTLTLIAVLALLGIYLKHTAGAPRVTASFLSYTNAGSGRFVLLSFVNREKVPIDLRGVFVEEDGSKELHAPVMNKNLPWITKLSLESGDSEVLAVKAELPSARWRVRWDYVRAGSTNIYSARSRWFEP